MDASANTDTVGIKFIQGLTWDQIKKQAKAENKYIFVDCYTTWCGPCKAMERNVYPQKIVSDYINANFISVKYQLDTTELDSEDIKQKYHDASALREEFNITAFPTFLFFSPTGQLVYRSLGYKEPMAFLNLAEKAREPNLQYQTLLSLFKEDKLDQEKLQELLTILTDAGTIDEHFPVATKYFSTLSNRRQYPMQSLVLAIKCKRIPVVNEFIKSYKENILDTAGQFYICQKDVLQIINAFADSLIYKDGSKGNIFGTFWNAGQKVDSAISYQGFSSFFVTNVITKEEVYQKINGNGNLTTRNPNWEVLYKNIQKKYGYKYTREMFLNAQLEFYKTQGDWTKVAFLFEKAISENKPRKGGFKFSKAIGGVAALGNDAWALNAIAWDLFLNCSDKKILKKALTWIELSIKLSENSVDPQFLDTKANLLYRIGNTSKAIAVEKSAIALANKLAQMKGLNQSDEVKEYIIVLKKMETGEPTWILKR